MVRQQDQQGYPFSFRAAQRGAERAAQPLALAFHSHSHALTARTPYTMTAGNTAAAVRQFQTDYGLQVDSIAGDQTMSALRQASSLKLDPAKSDFKVSSPKLTGGGADISPAIPDFKPPLT